MASGVERDPIELEILRLILASGDGLPNIVLMDALEGRGVSPGAALRALRRLEARGFVFTNGGRWRVTSVHRVE